MIPKYILSGERARESSGSRCLCPGGRFRLAYRYKLNLLIPYYKLMGEPSWLYISKPEVPNHRVADRYRAVDHLVPGRKERIKLFTIKCILFSLVFRVFYFEKLPLPPAPHARILDSVAGFFCAPVSREGNPR